MKRELIKVDKNGTKHFATFCKCDRCGGTGVYTWGGTINGRPMYAGTCFKCGGAQYLPTVEKEYTPEYRAKLDAANEKRKAKLRAKAEERRAAQEAEWERTRAEREAEAARREAERLAEIERNRGQFVGQVGDKIEVTVTLERTFQYEVPCYGAPWKTDLVTGYVFKTDEGNTLVWKTTGSIARKKYVAETEQHNFVDRGGCYTYEHVEDGDRITIRGTIKGHEEYNNVNQTMLTRVKWVGEKEVA